MSDDKRNIRREWADFISSLQQDRCIDREISDPFGGVRTEWDDDPEAWSVIPIIARHRGQIDGLTVWDDE